MATIVLTDDHTLLRNGLAGLLGNLGHTVLFEADNGKDLIEKLDPQKLPDILMLDINMPEMDGYETAKWMSSHYPNVKILALSMYDNEQAIINMLKYGAKGYILKDCSPSMLRDAILSMMEKGYYYSDLVSDKLIHVINETAEAAISTGKLKSLNDREKEFLKYACTELTYKEIGDKMFLSPRTIDGYRDALFEKLNVKSRVGLVIYAIRNSLVNISE